jgi:glycosyltransferase involved in cell wall biosynthesis
MKNIRRLLKKRGEHMILALIPAYNEEKSIGDVIRGALKYVDKVIVIDDGSSDKTYDIAYSLGATVLRHSRNMGVGASIRTGINYAKKVNPELIIILDADGQHDPNDIPRLIQPILSGQADFVLGSRFLQGNPTMPLLKFIGNKFLSLLVSILLCTRVTDAQTGFRALNRRALMALHIEAEYTYVQEMIIKLYLKGCKLKEVPIKVRQRRYGRSKVASSIIRYIIRTLPIIFRTYIHMRTRSFNCRPSEF